MRSALLDKILKETPLDTRLKVSNQAAFINLITELGFRENKSWDEEDEKDNALLLKLTKLANEHTDNQVKTLRNWEDDTGADTTFKAELKAKLKEAIDSGKYGPNFVAGLVFVKNILLEQPKS